MGVERKNQPATAHSIGYTTHRLNFGSRDRLARHPPPLARRLWDGRRHCTLRGRAAAIPYGERQATG